MDTTTPVPIIKLLTKHYDFDIKRRPKELFFAIQPEIALTPIAGDAAGGLFMTLADKGDILYVDTEGSGGIIAPDIDSLFLLFVCHPYWDELLKYSGGGNLAEMRRAFPVLHNDYYHERPERLEAGETIRRALQLPPVTDVVDQLHASVSSTPQRLTICAPDGSAFGSLFGQFTIERSAAWRSQHRPI